MKAPFDGVLVPEYQFREIQVQATELQTCEKFLKQKDCGDKYLIKKPQLSLLTFGAGVISGLVLMYLVNP